MASTKVPFDDRSGDSIDPTKEPAGDNADGAREIVGRTDKERELSERVRRKIKSVSSKTKRYLN